MLHKIHKILALTRGATKAEQAITKHLTIWSQMGVEVTVTHVCAVHTKGGTYQACCNHMQKWIVYTAGMQTHVYRIAG